MLRGAVRFSGYMLFCTAHCVGSEPIPLFGWATGATMKFRSWLVFCGVSATFIKGKFFGEASACSLVLGKSEFSLVTMFVLWRKQQRTRGIVKTICMG
jgi:hypothetical protein